MTRPRLLIRAARFGVANYNRKRDLLRIVQNGRLPAHRYAVERLVDVESTHEEKRRAGDAAYSITRHVFVLIALMAEFRMMQTLKSGTSA
jgi:hypothetical protein